MRIYALATIAAIAMAAAPAAAHPGAKLLTAGASKEQTATSGGVRYSAENGVHLYRGSAPEAPQPLADSDAPRIVNIEIEQRVIWRRLRTLRTQGFYSGDKYPTRRYTQGFYSGD